MASNNPIQQAANVLGGVSGGVTNGGFAQAGSRSDPRFRSFVERYVIERARLFRPDQAGHDEDLWNAMMDAKRAYSVIRRMGQHLDPEDM